LFRDGRITWGRVLTLLCFGYRIALTLVERGIRGFFANVVGFIVRFVFAEKIARWIAEQGGWVRSFAVFVGVNLCGILGDGMRPIRFRFNTGNSQVKTVWFNL